MQGETEWQRMRKRLKYLMPSLPQPLTVRPAVLGHTASTFLSWRTGTGTERIPQNVQWWPATPFRHKHIFGHGWVSQGYWGSCPRCSPSTFNHWSAVLAHWGGPSWLEVNKSTPIYKKCRKLHPCQHDISAREVMQQILNAITQHTGRPGDQAQTAWLCERQVLLD